MKDLYLRANTEADLKDALAQFINEDGEWITATHTFAFDPIGAIETTPGVYDENNIEITAPVMDERFHANLRLIDESLESAIDTTVIISPSPATPGRAWA